MARLGPYCSSVSPPMPSTDTPLVQMWRLGLISTGPMSTNAPASITVPPARTSSSDSRNVTDVPEQSTDDVGAEPAGRVAHRAHPLVQGRGGTRSGTARRRRRARARAARPSGRPPPGGRHPASRPWPGASARAGPTPTTATVSPKPKPPPSACIERAASRPWVTASTSVSAASSGGQLVGHAKQARARQQVHQLRPSAEQVRGLGAGERVAVVLESGAEVVGVALAQAEPAAPAGQVRRGHHPVAGCRAAGPARRRAAARRRSPRSRPRSRGRR